MSTAGSALRAVAGSATSAVGRLSVADRQLRTAIAVSRRIGFVAAAGGCGTTSALTSVASLLAGRRNGMVLAVDASGGRSGVLTQTTADQENDLDRRRQQELRRMSARTATDARHGLPRSATGLYLLDLAESDRWAVSPTAWADQLGPIARFYDLVLTDWGVRWPSVDAEAIAALNHVLVVVGRADPYGAATAAAFTERLAARLSAETSTDLAAPQLMLLLVDVAGGVRLSRRSRSALAARLGLTVSLLPHEPARAREIVPDSRRFSARTRSAHIELGASLVTAAARSRSAGTVRTPGRAEPGWGEGQTEGRRVAS